jgi:hypothetical protein
MKSPLAALGGSFLVTMVHGVEGRRFGVRDKRRGKVSPVYRLWVCHLRLLRMLKAAILPPDFYI